MLLIDIKEYLQSQGVTDTTYVGQLPDGPDTCLALFEYAGQPPHTLIESETPGLQIQVRVAAGSNDYQTGRAKAEQIHQALHGKKNLKINSTRYIHIRATGSPAPLGRDRSNRPIFVLNFLVRKDRE